jgi:Uma2 family endonuclease
MKASAKDRAPSLWHNKASVPQSKGVSHMVAKARKEPMKTLTRQPLPETFGDLLEGLGNISPHRIRLQPPPGTATEKDLLDVLDRTNRICELVDGVLVEKVMGYPESSLAVWLSYLLHRFLQDHDLGNLAGADGTMRLMPKLVRIPDISFVRWEKLPGRELPAQPIPELVPDLAVEVLSEGNTPAEIARKLREYSTAGVTLVWLVDMRARVVKVCTGPDQLAVLREGDTLDGGKVLPGLALPVEQIFARVPRQPTRRRAANAKKSPRKKSGNGRP